MNKFILPLLLLGLSIESYAQLNLSSKYHPDTELYETATMKLLNHLNLLLPSEKAQLQQYEEKQLFNHSKIHIGSIKAIIQ